MSSTTNRSRVDLCDIFLGLQREMEARLSANRENIPHPGTKGDVTELSWGEMLSNYLPERYRVAKAFVLDSLGNLSDQIDVVIFDRQYSPFLLKQKGAQYVPAESVYAIIEVKQSLGKSEIKYAGQKAASVRELHRTSAPIPHAGGTYEPKPPFEILAGIVTLDSTWSPPLGTGLESVLTQLAVKERIDLGCALQCGAFEIRYGGATGPTIEKDEKNPLIFFFFRLLYRLQQLGTAPALDILQYAKSLKERPQK